ncbi:MAG: efflux RND transporter permease subunit [Phycisphaeraceae bacterium]
MSLPRFGVNKPVPVNLLWMAILVAGLLFGLTLRREFFPEVNPDQAMVTMPYPGASPEEVEEALAIKVEDKLSELDEIDDLYTTIAEGGGGIVVEFREGINTSKALDEVERRIDSLQDLPSEAERIQVQLFEPKLPVIRVNVFGQVDEDSMKRAIRGIRDDLRELPNMGEILIGGVRNYEIRIDVNQAAMLSHGISLPQITEAVRGWMREVPGGTVRTGTGNVKIRMMGVQERAAAISQIVLRGTASGATIRLSDVATISEDFVDEQVFTRFNGQPSASLTVFKVGEQDIVTMAEMVRAYVDGRNKEPFVPSGPEAMKMRSQTAGKPQSRQTSPVPRLLAWELGHDSKRPLPAGASIEPCSDLARFVEGRLDLLTRNAATGATLVFIILMLFMSWRGAIWVTTGLITAVMGTLVLMAVVDVTLNLLTMFGLIIVLGMLVDDAVVIAENIESKHYKGEPALLAAINGTEQVMWPVVGTVMTTIVAFLPLMFIKGRIGDLMSALPAVVTCALLVSLLESIVILPSHMGHGLARGERKRPGLLTGWITRYGQWRDKKYFEKIVPAFGRVLSFLLRNRYATIAAAVALLMISLAMLHPMPSGRVKYDFLPSSDAETIVIDIRMPIGTPIEKTNDIVSKIEAVCGSLKTEVKSIETLVGVRSNIETGSAEAFTPHVAQIFVELTPVEERDRESPVIINDIRNRLSGLMDEVERINYNEITGGPGGPGITIRIRGEDFAHIDEAVIDLKQTLAKEFGVIDINDNSDLGQIELRIRLKPGAAALGFTSIDVAQQVRGFLYGLDAHVFAADQEDIDVRVRLSEKSRRSLYSIENSWLVSPKGKNVPLSEIADIDDSATYSTIKRVNRMRAVTVTASTIPGLSPEAVLAKVDLDAFRSKYPLLRVETAGRQEQQSDAFGSLPTGFMIGLMWIYVILAWLFSSYLQPFLVMTAIPFSLIGVIWGHYLLGFDLTFLSLIGFVALMGIVVNNSIVLVEFYNHERREGKGVQEALVEAGKSRLRAIFLTSLTTIFGLMPLILEQSFQAKFLIPMAITIAFGLAASSVMVLTVLPCLMLVLDDVKALAYYLWNGRPRPHASVAPKHYITDGL